MKVVIELDSYLGLPILISKRRSAAFQNILDRTAIKVNSWSKRLLSNGGKKIFIKSILQSLPTYAFSIFFAPNGMLEELQSMICHSWWGGKDNNRGWHMLSWDWLCFPKGMGATG
ncbi:hypothetical protein J1N35_001494 [Gossypium stocksii]|uniref:Uncharacterized protein n=1 Tax=Gossypium stocksii TaxID=47602 RepID=A0A9D3WKM2_9ROSI|nr:hypothetical protein J1N35_001494 [Gossypium stocksii]